MPAEPDFTAIARTTVLTCKNAQPARVLELFHGVIGSLNKDPVDVALRLGETETLSTIAPRLARIVRINVSPESRDGPAWAIKIEAAVRLEGWDRKLLEIGSQLIPIQVFPAQPWSHQWKWTAVIPRHLAYIIEDCANRLKGDKTPQQS